MEVSMKKLTTVFWKVGVTSIVIYFTLMILITGCSKDEPTKAKSDEVNPAEYAGIWTGTTGNSYPVYIHVTNDGIIDSLAIGVTMYFPSFSCTAYFFADTTVQIVKSKFSADISTPASNLYTTMHGTFSSLTAVSGTYDDYYTTSFYAFCGGYLTIGTGSAGINGTTWQATKQ
jgi:hypothetical protein